MLWEKINSPMVASMTEETFMELTLPALPLLDAVLLPDFELLAAEDFGDALFEAAVLVVFPEAEGMGEVELVDLVAALAFGEAAALAAEGAAEALGIPTAVSGAAGVVVVALAAGGGFGVSKAGGIPAEVFAELHLVFISLITLACLVALSPSFIQWP